MADRQHKGCKRERSCCVSESVHLPGIFAQPSQRSSGGMESLTPSMGQNRRKGLSAFRLSFTVYRPSSTVWLQLLCPSRNPVLRPCCELGQRDVVLLGTIPHAQ